MANSAKAVLIVDDEPALLKMLRFFLQRLGYTVTAAETTEAAWSAVEAAPEGFDVAVLDATMAGPGLTHLALKMLRASPRLRILVASGYLVDMSGIEAAAGGRTAFLQKPFSPEMLAAAVRRILGSQEESL
jgi:DNA-binding NtrC family response regulator